MPAFEIQSVTKWRFVPSSDGGTRRVLALSDVSLEVPERSIMAVVGPSGSGKSTLLRLLVRLEEPDEGTIRYAGTPLRDFDALELRRRVGLVQQQPAMFTGSVAENVAYGPSLRGEWTARDAERVGELLDTVGLPRDFAPREAQQLSGGERQRVAIARALANRPEALLLDEPTSALDPGAARHVLEAIRRASESAGVTTVLVCHALAHARAVADHAAVLVAGELTESGTAERVLTAPESPQARAFIEQEPEAGAEAEGDG